MGTLSENSRFLKSVQFHQKPTKITCRGLLCWELSDFIKFYLLHLSSCLDRSSTNMIIVLGEELYWADWLLLWKRFSSYVFYYQCTTYSEWWAMLESSSWVNEMKVMGQNQESDWQIRKMAEINSSEGLNCHTNSLQFICLKIGSRSQWTLIGSRFYSSLVPSI